MSGNRSASNSTNDVNRNKYKNENRNERKSRNEMDNINETIDVINKIQIYSRKYDKSNINFPEIVVIGSQSTGKSSILERIISVDILPKDKETCTKCPIVLQLSKSSQDEIKAEFLSENNLLLEGELNIKDKIQEITSGLQEFSKTPIIIELTKKDFPKLTLVDLPGLIKNINTGNEQHIKDIEDLAEDRAKSLNSIILAVSSANVDLANSDSIKLSRKFDPEGTRTFHIITKIDLMDKGTDARDLLKNELLSKSLGVILLKNRSQKSLVDKKAISTVHSSEQKFLEKHYPEIHAQHGIDVLISKLVNILHNKIRNFLPKIREELQFTKKSLELEINRFNKPEDEMSTLITFLHKFMRKYERIIYGDKNKYCNNLSGGSLISMEIYDKFEKEINDLNVDNFNKESIKTLLRNTAGIKKTAYSIEKAYANISRAQISKFVRLIEKSLHNIKILLEEFVDEAIIEMNISKFYNLNLWINKKMQDFIDKHFENTDKIIKSLIDCEKNHVSCALPIGKSTKLVDNSNNQSKSKISILNNVIPMVTSMVTIPTYVMIGLQIADRVGLIDKLVECVSSEIYDMLYEAGEDSEKIELKKYEEDFKNFVNENEGIQKIYEFWETEMKNKDDQNDKLLMEMVNNNFKEVKETFICNFPKWIQKFMIKDLLKTMNTMIEYFKDDPSHLLKLDEEHENNLGILRKELKEIENIENDLNKCIKNL